MHLEIVQNKWIALGWIKDWGSSDEFFGDTCMLKGHPGIIF